MKKSILRIVLGVVSSIAVMALLFYAFLFLNPLHIHNVNLLKWIPILICVAALFTSGVINKKTPIKLLPALFIPFVIFDLFNFFYLPFIAILFFIGALTLVITRDEIRGRYRALSAATIAGVFAYFLLAQPLILENEHTERNANGELVNATVLWDFSDRTATLPNHVVMNTAEADVNLKDIGGKTHFMALWATWCAPCLEEKPQLDQLKHEFQDAPNVGFVDLSIDDEKRLWENFLADKQPAGRQLLSKNVSATRRALNIGGIPLYFVVDEDGSYKAFTSIDKASEVFKASVNR